MKRSVIISQNQELISRLKEFFVNNTMEDLIYFDSSDAARADIINKDYDYVFIDIVDKSCEELAIDLSDNYMCQVIVFVTKSLFEYVCDIMSEYGIVTIEKPVDGHFLQLCYNMTVALKNKIIRIENENKKLLGKIEEIRLVNKAKAFLIRKYKISEEDAHKLIEHQAMNLRKTKGEIATFILKEKE